MARWPGALGLRRVQARSRSTGLVHCSVFRRKPKVPTLEPDAPPRSWLDGPPADSDIHVVLTGLLDTGQQWRSLRTNRVFDVSFADALTAAKVGDRAYLRYLGPSMLGSGKVGFVRDPRFCYQEGRDEDG